MLPYVDVVFADVVPDEVVLEPSVDVAVPDEPEAVVLAPELVEAVDDEVADESVEDAVEESVLLVAEEVCVVDAAST